MKNTYQPFQTDLSFNISKNFLITKQLGIIEDPNNKSFNLIKNMDKHLNWPFAKLSNSFDVYQPQSITEILKHYKNGNLTQTKIMADIGRMIVFKQSYNHLTALATNNFGKPCHTTKQNIIDKLQLSCINKQIALEALGQDTANFPLGFIYANFFLNGKKTDPLKNHFYFYPGYHHFTQINHTTYKTEMTGSLIFKFDVTTGNFLYLDVYGKIQQGKCIHNLRQLSTTNSIIEQVQKNIFKFSYADSNTEILCTPFIQMQSIRTLTIKQLPKDLNYRANFSVSQYLNIVANEKLQYTGPKYHSLAEYQLPNIIEQCKSTPKKTDKFVYIINSIQKKAITELLKISKSTHLIPELEQQTQKN